MTSAALRVSRQPPVSPRTWFGLVSMPGGGWPGTNAAAAGSVYYNGNTYFGYIDGDGNIRVASFNHTTLAVAISPAIVSGLTIDYHNSPGVLVRSSDHKIVVAASPHSGTHMYVAVSTNAEDVTSWGAATDIASTLGASLYTYPELFQLSGESGKIYLFYRDGDPATTAALCFSTSTDGGATWTAQTTLWSVSGKASYWALCSDDTSRIDIITTDGSAGQGQTASLYHFYYTGGAYHKSDGTLITAGLPLVAANATKVFDSSNGSVEIPDQITPGLVAAWTAYDPAGSGSNEKYWYGAYSGGVWSNHQIDDSGVVPQIPGIVSGCVAIDAVDSGVVYVSRYTSGRWQMFRYTTADGGATWSDIALTSDTSDGMDIHPRVSHNAAPGLKCQWISGPIGPNGSPMSCQIRGYPNPSGRI